MPRHAGRLFHHFPCRRMPHALPSIYLPCVPEEGMPSMSQRKIAALLTGMVCLALAGRIDASSPLFQPPRRPIRRPSATRRGASIPSTPSSSPGWKAPASNRRRADKLRLLRRVTFDLTGLPPTLDEQDAFLTDDSPDAYEKVVDRLLASPHYGERLAHRLARPGALRRNRRLQGRRPAARGVPLPRLRHPQLQRRPALRPLRPPAAGRRRAGTGQSRRSDRHRLSTASGPTSTTPPTWSSGVRRSSTT